MSQTPFPPSDLIRRVGVEEAAGGDAEVAFFDESGRRAKQDIVSALPADWAWQGKSVLDFGCGSGRVLRHFSEEAEHCHFSACDIDERSIRWLNEQRIGMHIEHFGCRFDDSWGPAVYVSEWWFREHWGRAFDVLRYRPHGFAGSAEDKRTGAGQAWAVLSANKTKAPSPAELTQPRPGDARELAAAVSSRDLVYAEIADLRERELRRLNRDRHAQEERIRALASDLARTEQALREGESSTPGHLRSLAGRLRRRVRRARV